MPARDALFLGFFGPRGVAAIFYATVVVEAHILDHNEQLQRQVLVWTTVTCLLGRAIRYPVPCQTAPPPDTGRLTLTCAQWSPSGPGARAGRSAD